MGVTSSPIDWYAARAAGIVAYLLLTAVVLVGLTLSGRMRLPRWPRFAVTELHRYGSLLAGVFVSLHVVAIALDSYTPFSPTQLLVPLTSAYRPVWTALGIVSAELLVAVAVTNLLRRRIPYRLWRRIHYANFAVWGLAGAHGIGAGTDGHSAWMLALYAVAVSSVLAALVRRAARERLARPTRRSVAGLAALVGLAVVVALASAPHGRAARQRIAPPASFSDSFTGSIGQREGPGGALLSVTGKGTGARRVLLRIDLITRDGRTFSDAVLQIRDLRSGAVCRGTVTSIGSIGFRGSCSFPGSGARSVDASWRLRADRSVDGSLDLRP